MNFFNQKNKNQLFGGEASKKKALMSTAVLFLVFSFISAPMVSSAATTIKTPSKTGLVGYWNFNEGAGTQAGDISGNGNTGTITGTPIWGSGKFGKALSFDGSTNYIQAGTIPSVTKSGTYTFSAWLKSSTVGTQTIFQSSPSCIDRNGAALSGSTLAFGYYNGTAWVGASGTAPANRYFHVVGINNGGTLSLYINGVLQVGTGVPYVHCADGNFYLGQETFPGDLTKFAGTMDDLRIYNRALSASEVTTLYKSGATVIKNSVTTNLLGYWPLNGDYGDYSGRRNDFTVNGTCLSTSTDAVTGGISVTGWATCGTSPQKLGYLSTGNIFNSAEEFTFIAWVKGTGTLWSGAPTFWLQVNATGAYLDKYTGSWVNVATGSGGGTSSGWRQIVVTKKSYGGIKIYSNTVEIASSTAQTFYTPTSQTVGRYAVYDDSGYHFTGKIDDVRLYNKVLSQAEINSLYKIRPATVNVGQNNKVTNSLIGLWSFDGKDMNWGSNTAFDRSGNGNNGRLMNMSTTTSPTPGKIGQGINFDGVNDYIDIGGNMASNDMAISMWIKPHATSGYLATEGVINSGIRFILYFSAGNKITWSCYNAGYKIATTDSAIPLNRWTHIVGTIKANDIGGVKIYVNGEVQATTDTTSACGAYGTFYLGSYIWPIGSYYNGLMDDVRVYNRNLSASEVKQLYNLAR